MKPQRKCWEGWGAGWGDSHRSWQVSCRTENMGMKKVHFGLKKLWLIGPGGVARINYKALLFPSMFPLLALCVLFIALGWVAQTCFDRPILPWFLHLAALSHLQAGAFAKPSFPSNALLLAPVSCKCNYSSLPISFISDRDEKGSEMECADCTAMMWTGNTHLLCQTASFSEGSSCVWKGRRSKVCKMIRSLMLDWLWLVYKTASFQKSQKSLLDGEYMSNFSAVNGAQWSKFMTRTSFCYVSMPPTTMASIHRSCSHHFFCMD